MQQGTGKEAVYIPLLLLWITVSDKDSGEAWPPTYMDFTNDESA